MAEDISNQEVGTELTDNGTDFVAPYPGDQSMPQWDTAGLVDAPKHRAFGMKSQPEISVDKVRITRDGIHDRRDPVAR